MTRSGAPCGCCRWSGESYRRTSWARACSTGTATGCSAAPHGRHGRRVRAARGVGDGPYWQFAAALALLGLGFGTAINPGTQLVIDGLPDRRAVRGGERRDPGGGRRPRRRAVAVSVLVAVYGRDLVTTGLSPEAAEQVGEGVAAAVGIAERLGTAGRCARCERP